MARVVNNQSFVVNGKTFSQFAQDEMSNIARENAKTKDGSILSLFTEKMASTSRYALLMIHHLCWRGHEASVQKRTGFTLARKAVVVR